ncbi:hypothetical protein FLCU109888_11560 [Flavobacterium cucumis]|uniref:Holin n=1 Tax=Flavobacterium cucumis TaxID=416016 RepID=A0A1M7ZVI6_9FLAO|nr:hypothetical protein [Flavobacterium cucumis]SHO72888.1 hypothetical protein SAMN05443547_1232 [Flavobacterium cucumis]
MKSKLVLWFIENLEAIKEALALFLVVVGGVGIKAWKAIQENTKLTIKWVVAEGFMSLVVALTAFAIFDLWLELHRLIVYVICVWAGGMSTIVHKEVEGLVSDIFDGVGNWVKRKL